MIFCRYIIYSTTGVVRIGVDGSECMVSSYCWIVQGCVLCPWLFNVHIDGVREIKARVLGKWLKLVRTNGGRFEINQLFLQMIEN